MRKILYSPMVLFLAGCTTAPMTGRKKLLGLIPVPFTGGEAVAADPNKMLIIEQLAPLVWCGMILFVGGGFMWYLTSGKTGLGKFSMMLGVGLILAATILPQIAGWLGLITILAIVGIGGYLIWDRIRSKAKTNHVDG